MLKIIYPVPEAFPDHRARFIQIINTCHALAEIGCEIYLITNIKRGYSIKKIFDFYGLKEIENLKILCLPSRQINFGKLKVTINTFFHLSLLRILKKLNKNEKTVIFLRHLKLANFLLKYRAFHKLPLVFEIHEIFHLTTTKRRMEKIRNIEREVYSKSTCLICISDVLNRYLIDNMKIVNKIFSIPDAVRSEWFDITPQHREYIIYCGSLYDWKGVDTLIKAMQYLNEEKLLIVGYGDNINKLKILSEHLGVSDRIIFAGIVPHHRVPEHLAKAKLAVLPNKNEKTSLFTSPLKLFEYMAAGLPIVASDLPVFREILTQEENALFFESDNPLSLANAIKKFLISKELTERVSKNNKKLAENYTYKKRAEKIYAICNELK